MLRPNTNYMWQVVCCADGNRSEVIVGTVEEFQEHLLLTPDEKRNDFLVLPLAELEAEDPNEFVLRFPLMSIGSFLTYLTDVETNPNV